MGDNGCPIGIEVAAKWRWLTWIGCPYRLVSEKPSLEFWHEVTEIHSLNQLV